MKILFFRVGNIFYEDAQTKIPIGRPRYRWLDDTAMAGTDGWMILQWIFCRQVLKLTGQKFITTVKQLVSAVNYINLRVRNERTTSKNENP
jgi:hypothetical protein